MEDKAGGGIFTFCILISVLLKFYYHCAHDIIKILQVYKWGIKQ